MPMEVDDMPMEVDDMPMEVDAMRRLTRAPGAGKVAVPTAAFGGGS